MLPHKYVFHVFVKRNEVLEIFSQLFQFQLSLPYLPEQNPHKTHTNTQTLVHENTHMHACAFMHLCVHVCVVCALIGRTEETRIKLKKNCEKNSKTSEKY